jgi:hypothetical protein
MAHRLSNSQIIASAGTIACFAYL